MKNRMIAGLFVLLFLCQCTNDTDVDTYSKDCLPYVADKYVYPIDPGTDEWKNLGSWEEIIKAYQLPDDVLKTISTPGLIRSFLDAPTLRGGFYASSSSSGITRISSVYSSYNSAQELIGRKDAAEELLLFFDAVCFDCLKRQKEIDRMTWDDQVSEAGKQLNFMAQLAAVEVFFTQQNILNRLSYADKQKAVALLLSKSEQLQKLNIEGLYDPAALEVMACVMYHAPYRPVVKYFGTQPHFDVTADKVENVISFAQQFIR